MVGKFLWILAWESLQNLAFILGFVYATYLWIERRKTLSLMVVIMGTVLGSLAIGVTESLIYGEPAALNWEVGILVNVITFTLLAVLAILYLNGQANSRWDLGVSFGFGALVALAQFAVDPYSALGVIAHIVAMSASFYLFIRSTRWAIRSSNGTVVAARALLINLVGSAIIVAIDYGYLIL